MRDRSAVITCLVAPLAIAAILGFAFAGNTSSGVLPIGVSGASPALLRAAVHASQLPPNVVVRLVGREAAVTRDVDDGTLAAGVVLRRHQTNLSHLLIPMVAPGATPSPGFDVVDRANALIGQEYAESLAAGLASRLYAGRLQRGTATARGGAVGLREHAGEWRQGGARLLRALHRGRLPLHRERPGDALPPDGAVDRDAGPAGRVADPVERHCVGEAPRHCGDRTRRRSCSCGA